MKVYQIKENQKTSFNDFVKKHGTLLQSWEWGEFKSKFGWRPYRLIVEDKGEAVLAISLLAKSLFLGKSFLYAPEGPVVTPKISISALRHYLNKLLVGINKITEKEKAILLRFEPLTESLAEVMVQNNFIKSFEDIQPKIRLWIDLSKTEEEILKQMKHKGRYNIKIAQKRGVIISKLNDTSMLDVFYSLYIESAKRDHFTPRPKKYFKELIDLLKENKIGILIFAFYKKIPLGAAIVTFWGQYASYLYGGSSSAYREVMPFYLLQWEAIKEAKKRGCRIYDFGGISPAGQEGHIWAGLRQFKTRFGGEEKILPGCFDLVYDKFSYMVFKITEKIRRMV